MKYFIPFILMTMVVLSGCDSESTEKQAKIKADADITKHSITTESNERIALSTAKITAHAEKEAKIALGTVAEKQKTQRNADNNLAAQKKLEERNRLVEVISQYAIPMVVIAFVLSLVFWLRKQAGIKHREIEAEENIKRDKARYEAFKEALNVVPEKDRVALIEQWVDKGNNPQTLSFAG